MNITSTRKGTIPIPPLTFCPRHQNKLKDLHIPHSSVFYVRAAIEADTGVRYSLRHVETAMKAEGMLKDV